MERQQRRQLKQGAGLVLWGVGVGALLAAGCAGHGAKKDARAGSECEAPRRIATASLSGRSGTTLLGNGVFEQRDNRLWIRVQVQQAPAGRHGVFLHQGGDCAGTHAEASGGIYNPTRAPAGGAGRLGDLEVGTDGNGELSLSSDQLTIPAGPLSVLGRSLVIHWGNTDAVVSTGGEPTQSTTPMRPTEKSGRIGCGIITLRADLLGM